jgi:hypothetical protein
MFIEGLDYYNTQFINPFYRIIYERLLGVNQLKTFAHNIDFI